VPQDNKGMVRNCCILYLKRKPGLEICLPLMCRKGEYLFIQIDGIAGEKLQAASKKQPAGKRKKLFSRVKHAVKLTSDGYNFLKKAAVTG
jgi:hypothetical protein